MNRPIKFRAWQREEDEYYSRMVSSSQSIVTAFRHVIGEAAPSGFSDCDNQPDKNRYVLMQSTGLEDKNGVEIFEGDIIKDGEEAHSIFFDGVKFVAVGFYDASLDTPWDVFSEFRHVQTEVIGNIYENPELLKGADE